MNNNLSIILCFYNAGSKLINTIRYLINVDISELDNVELIFVDNNSTDNSCEIINNLLKDFKAFEWKIVTEKKSGLSYARLKGLQEAKYDILLYCDDDNWLFQNYVSIGMAALQKDDMIAVLGGNGIETSDIDFPDWFEENKTYYAVGKPKPFIIKGLGEVIIIYGAGMFIRKKAFLDIINKGFQYFNPGRKGKKLSSGEDTEMSLAFLIAGYKVVFNPDLKFYHFLEANRLSLKHLNKLKLGIAGSRFLSRFYLEYLNGYIPNVNSAFWIKELIYSCKDLFIGFFKFKNMDAIKRNILFTSYLLNERNLYNKNVKGIISICKALDNANKE